MFSLLSSFATYSGATTEGNDEYLIILSHLLKCNETYSTDSESALLIVSIPALLSISSSSSERIRICCCFD